MAKEHLRERVNRDFTYHSPKPGQPERYTKIRDAYKNLANTLVDECPESRELSVALTELETSNFYANAAIARNE